jgi:RNA polymerase sigma factor (sigma-70 family)
VLDFAQIPLKTSRVKSFEIFLKIFSPEDNISPSLVSLLVEGTFIEGTQDAEIWKYPQMESKMAFRKNAKSVEAALVQAVSDWTIADLSALYADQRSSLNAQARRILRSEADASEIVQEAFLKFIMAAPELDSRERALAYLRTTVNNLCLNQIRATGSRPNLVAIDSDSSQERLDEIAADAHIPFDSTLAAAEDASIIREALSRLSPDQRTALVMWEMEGRTTEEIAAAIGTTPANVRHVVARSRTSLVRVLSEWIVDEETGATALDALSSSYKKAAELAKKSSKVALSLVLLLAAFLGFTTFNGKNVIAPPTSASTSTTSTASTTSTTTVTPAPAATSVAAPSKVANPSNPSGTPSKSSVPSVTPSKASTQGSSATVTSSKAPVISKLDTLSPTVDNKIATTTYAGIGTDGLPTGFTVTDLAGHTGSVIIGKPAPVVTDNGITLTAPVMSYDPKAVNVLINQVIKVDGSGTTYTPTPSISMNGGWVKLHVTATSTDIQRLPNGNYLVSSTMVTDSPVITGTLFPVSQGLDVSTTPTSISVRLVLNPGKTQVLAEAIQVAASGVTK